MPGQNLFSIFCQAWCLYQLIGFRSYCLFRFCRFAHSISLDVKTLSDIVVENHVANFFKKMGNSQPLPIEPQPLPLMWPTMWPIFI